MYAQDYRAYPGGKLYNEGMTDSSGISLSYESDRTNRCSSLSKHGLEQIAENHSELAKHVGMRNECYQGQSRQSFNSFLPPIETKRRAVEKGNHRDFVHNRNSVK